MIEKVNCRTFILKCDICDIEHNKTFGSWYDAVDFTHEEKNGWINNLCLYLGAKTGIKDICPNCKVKKGE